MSFSVLITLTAGTGGNTGPTFNLFSDADGYVIAFETGVAKSSLVAGYTSSVVPDGTTIIRCKSVGTCTNYTDFTISGLPAVCYSYDITNSSGTLRSPVYLDCNNVSQTISLDPSESINVCAYSITNSDGCIVSNVGVCPSPSPTPTPTPTPTGTPTISYKYYLIDKYNCPGCSVNTTGLIGRVTSPTSLTNGHYYNNGDGFVYLVDSEVATTSWTVDLDGSASSGTNCPGTCSI